MLNIRYNTFETNSSSVHTFVWHATDNSKIINDDYMEIRGGKYGRYPQVPLTTLEERLNYLWTAISNLCTSYNYDEENKIWHTIIDKQKLQEWKDIIYLYCPNVQLYDIIDDDNNWYYVDHVDYLAPLLNAMLKDKSILKDFLLDPAAKIYISGDEYTEEEEPFSREDIPDNIYYETLDFDGNTYTYKKGN